MLVKFSFENIFSFKDRQDFSMFAGKSKLKSERNIKIGNDEILKFSSIYGTNNSGKSNFIKALMLMHTIVTTGTIPTNNASYLFNDEPHPSLLEIGLSIDNKVYAYGFEFDFKSSQFHKEWLREITNTKSKVIFQRDIEQNTFVLKTVSNSFKKDLVKSSLLKHINANKNTLALYSIVNNGSLLSNTEEYQLLLKIYQWFYNSLNLTLAHQFPIYRIENEFDKNSFEELLVSFDTGIKKVMIEERDMSFFNRSEPHLSNLDKFPINVFHQTSTNTTTTFMVFGNSTWLIKLDHGTISYFEIIYYHEEELKVPIIFSRESDGTQRIIGLIGMLNSNNNYNTVFVIDELASSLHPLLTKKFIESFFKLNANNKVQLIMSSHETNIMDLDLLRRDEIWFVNKENNASELYSLEEFSVRFDLKLDKAYLDGRFGAIPNFNLPRK